MKQASIYSATNAIGVKVMCYQWGNSRAEVSATGATEFRVLKDGVWCMSKSYLAKETITKVKAALKD